MRLLVMIKKELMAVSRDYALLISLLIIPLILGFLVKLAIGPLHDAQLAIVDTDRTGLTSEITKAFVQPGSMKFIGYISAGEAEDYVQQGKADIVIIYPDNFSSQLLNGKQPTIRIILDDSDPRMYFNIDIVSQYVVPAVMDNLRNELLHSLGSKPQALITFSDLRGKITLMKQVFSGVQGMCLGPIEAVELKDNLDEVKAFNVDLQNRLPTIVATIAAVDPQSALEFQQRAQRASTTINRMDETSSRFENLDAQQMHDLQADMDQLDQIMIDMENFIRAMEDPSLLVFPMYVKRERVRTIDITNTYVPIIMPFIVFLTSMLLSSQSLMTEKIETLERLMTTPLKKIELLVGKFSVLVLFEGVLQGGLLMILTQYLFGFPYSIYSHIVLSLTAAFSVGLGMVTASLTRSNEENMKLIGLILLLFLFFGGVINPINMMDPQIQPVAQLLPISKSIHAMQDAMLRNTITWESAYIGASSLVFLAVAWVLL